MKIYKTTQTDLIADDVKEAKNFYTRSIGLLSKKSILKNEGLIIKPCCSIHTFFMKFEIDVLFMSKKNEVIALYENVKPYKVLPIHFKSSYVVELAAGVISDKNIKKGDLLIILKTSSSS